MSCIYIHITYHTTTAKFLTALLHTHHPSQQNPTEKADGTPGEKKTFDAVVAACDVPGIQKLLPESFRKIKEVGCVLCVGGR